MSVRDEPDEVDFNDSEDDINVDEYADEEEAPPANPAPVQPAPQAGPPAPTRRQRRRARQQAQRGAAQHRAHDLRAALDCRRREHLNVHHPTRAAPAFAPPPAQGRVATDPGAIIASLQHLLALGYSLGAPSTPTAPAPFPGQHHSRC